MRGERSKVCDELGKMRGDRGQMRGKRGEVRGGCQTRQEMIVP
jgi:hypothetical protein